MARFVEGLKFRTAGRMDASGNHACRGDELPLLSKHTFSFHNGIEEPNSQNKGYLGQFPALLHFSKLFLRLLQIGQALFEFRTKDLRLLVKPGILNRNRSWNRE